MNARVALLTGALTTALFLGVGIPLFLAGHTITGALVTGLGVLRGVVWIRQLAAFMRRDDD